MTALTDLQDAAASEGQVLNALMADIDDLTAKLTTASQNDDSDAIESIVAQMKQATATAQAKLSGGASTTTGGQVADTTTGGQGADTTTGGQGGTSLSGTSTVAASTQTS